MAAKTLLAAATSAVQWRRLFRYRPGRPPSVPARSLWEVRGCAWQSARLTGRLSPRSLFLRWLNHTELRSIGELDGAVSGESSMPTPPRAQDYTAFARKDLRLAEDPENASYREQFLDFGCGWSSRWKKKGSRPAHLNATTLGRVDGFASASSSAMDDRQNVRLSIEPERRRIATNTFVVQNHCRLVISFF
jgi:hypothetical protein